MSVSIEQQVRRRHYIEAVEGESVYDDQQIWRDELERYLLVERSRYDSDIFLTTFSDPDDAATYHDCQDYPEDWNVVALIDLDTGLALGPVTTTSWEAST